MQAILGTEFAPLVIPRIKAAKKSIDIVVFDWRWYPNDPANRVQLFNIALVAAVKRGVRVRAVSNARDICSILDGVGVKARQMRSKKLIHCKLMVIDQSTVIVGSHNYTANAFYMNLEASIAVDDPQIAANFTDFFCNLYEFSAPFKTT